MDTEKLGTGRRPASVALGDTYGRLTVVAAASSDGRGRRWRCRCVCGAEFEVPSGSLRSGNTKSCGCLQREAATRRGLSNTTHGAAGHGGINATPTYHSWRSMKLRCTNPSQACWTNYGGRGITFCSRWARFANFLADMGERPDGLTLDRINNDGNYEPGNCRWATLREQRANRRDAAHTGKEVI